MKFNWFKKSTPTRDALLEKLERESQAPESLNLYYEEVSLNGLPVVVADDDFLEFLAEEGYDDAVELDDMMVLYEEWAAENVIE